MSENPKIAIIGAGPSGLTALKNLITNGFDVTCFEMNDQIGGNLSLIHISEPTRPY